MTMPVYILDRTPGAEGRTIAWEKLCKLKGPRLIISYETMRDTSRWCSKMRGRPFVLYWDDFYTTLSSYKTLAAAEKAAARYAAELA